MSAVLSDEQLEQWFWLTLGWDFEGDRNSTVVKNDGKVHKYIYEGMKKFHKQS